MNNIDYSNATKQMTQSLVEAFGKKNKSGKTFTAKVTVTYETRCEVSYSGNTYTVSFSIPYSAGGIVRVCALCNNWQDLSVVEDKTGNNL